MWGLSFKNYEEVHDRDSRALNPFQARDPLWPHGPYDQEAGPDGIHSICSQTVAWERKRRLQPDEIKPQS